MSSDVGQQHPLALYFWIWGLLFVISAGSYLIDFFQVGYDVGTMELRWALILVFMFLKAGYIVAVFMHLKWERLALIYALPPAAGRAHGPRRAHGLGSRLHLAHAGRVLRRGSRARTGTGGTRHPLARAKAAFQGRPVDAAAITASATRRDSSACW